jgi:integrase/recombinase XerD
MLSVYTRHAADCAKAKDKDWRRWRCPKWISGTHGGELVRKSAKTRSWEKAEAYRRQLEGAGPTPVQTDESFRISERAPAGRHRDQKKARVTIETAVDAYLRDARSRELESSTLSKLEGIFRKQFLTWCTSEGYKFLDEVDLDASPSGIPGSMAHSRSARSKSDSSAFSGRASVVVTSPTIQRLA